jgi:hypothetical protein
MPLYYLNILPASQKIENRFYVMRTVIFRLGLLCGALIISGAIFLLPSYFLASFQRDEILAQVSYEEANPLRQHATDIDKSLTSSLNEIRTLRNALLTNRFISVMFSTLLSNTPSGIHISHVEFDADTLAFNFSGQAARRSDILDFQKYLKSIPYISDVVSPLSNITKESNIDFTLKVLIKS